MIEVRHLVVRAEEFALADVSFGVARGEVGLVLGPTGAGKTTVLEAIAGVRRAERGQVVLRGEDVSSLAPEERRVGIVYQHGFLFPHLSVQENVRYGAVDVAYADEIARRFGATELYSRRVRALSGGERQIVALARALAPRPDILLLDEPFAALDRGRRSRVRRELMALQVEQGITVLEVTHDLEAARQATGPLVLLDRGRVLQFGSASAVFGKPASSEVASFLEGNAGQDLDRNLRG